MVCFGTLHRRAFSHPREDVKARRLRMGSDDAARKMKRHCRAPETGVALDLQMQSYRNSRSG